MRIWSLHPKYLDAKGLVALWRETLLAQKVLQGNTKGYKNHPQLARFKEQKDPVASIAAYLIEVAKEAQRRGYQFDATKISAKHARKPIPVTVGQVAYEWKHLRAKLKQRDPQKLAEFKSITDPDPHPLFTVVSGTVEPWEKV